MCENQIRATSGKDLSRLKASTRRALNLAGGVSSAQYITRVRAAALSKFQSLSDEQFVPLDVILDIELDIGSPVITAGLASMQGYRLVSNDDRQMAAKLAAPDQELGLSCVAGILSSASAMANQMNEALTDGRINKVEAAEMSDLAERAIMQLRQIQAKANRQALVNGGQTEVSDDG